MLYYYYMNFGPGWGGDMMPWLPLFLAPFILVFIVWSLVWQGLGMWHAARRGEWLWFVVFLLIHTLGILEIIYLFAVAKLKVSELFGNREHRT